MNRRFEYSFFNYLKQLERQIMLRPLNLGGTTNYSGGSGGPPGGFIGSLPQTRVAYDLTELETDYTPPSGMSLLDNLNHIRYRISTLENAEIPGNIIVKENEVVVASGVTILNFDGSVAVTQDSADQVTITVTASGGTGSGEAYADIDFVSWYVDGSLAVASGVQEKHYVVNPASIEYVAVNLKDTGTAGYTVLDINKNGTSIFGLNPPVVNYNDADMLVVVFPSGQSLTAGDILTLDIDQVGSGAGGATVTVALSGYASSVTGTTTPNSLTVAELDGSPTVSNVEKITFSGASVTDLGSGEVLVSVSGGGSSTSYLTYSRWEDRIPPSSPHTKDDEFNDNSFDTGKWTEFDPANVLTVTEDSNGLNLAVGTAVMGRWCGVYQSMPSYPFQMIVGYTFVRHEGFGTYQFGIMLGADLAGAPTTSDLYTFTMTIFVGGIDIDRTTHTDYTAAGTSQGNVGSSGMYALLRPIMRLRGYSASSFYFDLSNDGRSWWPIFRIVNPGFTPAQIGLCAYRASNVEACDIAVDYVRFYNTTSYQQSTGSLINVPYSL